MSPQDDDGSDGSGTPQRRPFVVPTVGIGASAGGVQALQAFFEALPSDVGAAFAVVVHLDPEVQSELASIIATRTQMPVIQVAETVPLRPDHVYVIPPNRRLHVSNQEISAIEFDEPRGRRAPIDLFFRSLAAQHGDGCAVILTGAGSDGTIGVKAIKEAGGIILVQDPTEAEYPSMPRSAISTGLADFVLPVREIASQLLDLIKQKQHLSIEQLRPDDEEWLRRILAHVCVRTGNDFSKYKRSTILRRLARRMQVSKQDDLGSYYDFLRDNPEEAQALLADLLISVTMFFRDSEAFATLARDVLPNLFTGEDTGDQIRVWVPGCASGEEAYTLAILALEEASRHPKRPSIQVFGSDLDTSALAVAREGRYPVTIEADVNEERLHRFFSREGDHYQVRRELRDIVLFANHSVLKDPPFSRIDLISCRNLLIYLDRELQQQACSTFHYALNPGGYIFLGASEAADNPPGLFRTVDRKARIYQSTADAGDKPRLLPQLLGSFHLRAAETQLPPHIAPTAAAREAFTHRQALEVAAPPSILVTQDYRVLHLSESAGRFLQPSGGPLSGDVTDLVRTELRFDLRSALHRAFQQGEASLSMPVLVAFNGRPHRVYIQVKPISEGETPAVNAIVMFIEGEAIDADSVAAETAAAEPKSVETIRRLMQELQTTQDRLRTTREESEAANEELRAANEELQSINEEYRSTSEELETSKEELQSINEELQTVNSELKLKLEAVSRGHSDLQNLMAATDFGILFLDAGLRIKRFTPHVTDLFNINPTDEGRRITDFTNQLDYDELVADVRSVLRQLVPIGREIRSRNGGWYQVRMRPYRTVDDRIEGVVVSFVDITERRQTEEALRESEQKLRQEKRLVELSGEPILVWEFDDGSILDWNRGCEELYGYRREEALGWNKEELLATEVAGSSFAEIKTKLLASRSWSGEVRHRSKDGREVIVESRIDLDEIDGRRLVLESNHNITDHKLWEKRQRLLLSELAHRVKNTLAVVQAIAHQTLRYSPSGPDFIERFDGRLTALSRAHNLLVESDWTTADLRALARSQLEAYTASHPNRITIAGEPVALSAELATPFGLVLHELATNAAKHGSLSNADGTVHLEWKLKDRNQKRVLVVTWKEEKGPPVPASAGHGLGTSLIDEGIPGSNVRREFSPEGLVCTIELTLP